jgi:hypothetical protein
MQPFVLNPQGDDDGDFPPLGEIEGRCDRTVAEFIAMIAGMQLQSPNGAMIGHLPQELLASGRSGLMAAIGIRLLVPANLRMAAFAVKLSPKKRDSSGDTSAWLTPDLSIRRSMPSRPNR